MVEIAPEVMKHGRPQGPQKHHCQPRRPGELRLARQPSSRRRPGVSAGEGSASRGQRSQAAKVAVQKGDLVSVLVDARDGNHSCDLTDVEFKLTSTDPAAPGEWSLTRDVSANVLAGNPHADAQGH